MRFSKPSSATPAQTAITAVPIMLVLAVTCLSPQWSHSQSFVPLSQGQPFSSISPFGWTISPDGEWVVYVQDVDADGKDELWSVPSRGGAPVRLNAPVVTGNGTPRFQISTDSNYVVFSLDQETLGTSEVFSVPIAGPSSAAVKLSSVAAGADAFVESVGRDWVLFVEFETDFGTLFVVPIRGSASAANDLRSWIIDNETVFAQVSSGNDRALYRFSQTLGAGSAELFSVDLSANPPQQTLLNPTGATNPEMPRISNDGSRILFRDPSAGDLYAMPIQGPASAAVELSGVLAPRDPKFSNDSQTALFQSLGAPERLFSVPIDGPAVAAVQLSNVDVLRHATSADSQHVFYDDGGQRGTGSVLLYAVPIDGPATSSVTISDPSPNGDGVVGWALSPSDDYIVMQESRLLAGLSAGYRQPVADALANSELVWTIGITVTDFEIHPKGHEILLLGTLTNSPDDDQRLWTAPLRGTPHRERELLNEAHLPDGLKILEASYASNGTVVLRTGSGARQEIFAIPLVFRENFERGDASGWSAAAP